MTIQNASKILHDISKALQKEVNKLKALQEVNRMALKTRDAYYTFVSSISYTLVK